MKLSATFSKKNVKLGFENPMAHFIWSFHEKVMGFEAERCVAAIEF